MRIIRDMCSGIVPAPFDVIYNTNCDGSGTTARYKGSLVKAQDHNDEDLGRFFTHAGETTAMENVCGILEEDVAVSATYVLNVASGSGNWVRKMMSPVLPSTILEAEYMQTDEAGADNRDTAYVGAAAATSLTIPSCGTADILIGGWIYFLTGSNANYLHYIRDNNNTTGATLRTALVNAVATGDYCLVILPPLAIFVDFNATYTGIKSECVEASTTDEICGIETFISAPGIAKRKLAQDLDGLKISNARFFHQFTVPYENYWCSPNRA